MIANVPWFAIGDAALLLIAQMLSRLIGVLYTLVIARILRVDDFGIYNIALSAVVVLGVIQDLGISRSVVKETARNPAQAVDWVSRLVFLKLGVAGLTAALLPLLAYLVGYDQRTWAALGVAALILPSVSVWLLLENAAQGLHALRLVALLYVSGAIMQSAFGIGAVWLSNGSLAWALAAAAAAYTASAGLAWRAFERRYGRIRCRIDARFWVTIVRDSLPYLMVGLSSAAIGRVELVLLGYFGGETEAALFAAAFKIFEAALFAIYSIQIVLNAPIARVIRDDPARFEHWFGWEISLALIALVPAYVAGALLGPAIIGLLFPSAYIGASGPLLILSCGLPIAAIQVFSAGAMMLTDRQRAICVVQLGVVAAQVGLSVLLVPSWGAIGAALALVLSQAVAAAAFMTLAIRAIGPNRLRLIIVARALPVIGFSVAAWLCGWALSGQGTALAAASLAWLIGLVLWVQHHLDRAAWR